MHLSIPVPKRLFSRITMAAILGAWFLGAVPVFAQLTSKDIDDLRARGQKEGWTFTVTENPATAYTLDQLCGTKVPADFATSKRPMNTSLGSMTAPTAFDWRTTTGLPPIRNQGGCGSCWAFSTVGALECAIKVYEGQTVDLSEQWLVSCNRNGWGCDGGWLAFDYFMSRPDRCGGSGAVMESSFPYLASNGSCGCPYPHEYKIDRWSFIGDGNSVPSVAAMKQAILQYGPISVCVSADAAMQGYGGGVFNSGSSEGINHAVVLVGWDDAQGPSGVWIMRNSWGTRWGEGGYMRIAYNCSQIGFGAAYIEASGVGITADQTFGPGPLAVNFAGTTTRVPNQWTWDMGDGTTSDQQSLAHTYQPGCYNVSLTIQTATGTYVNSKPDFVWAYADTLIVSNTIANAGKTVRVDISAHNYLPLSRIVIPFTWAGAYALALDSVRTAGTRSSGWPLNALSDDSQNKRQSYEINYAQGGPGWFLPAGEGPVLSLYFHSAKSIPGGTVLPVKVISYGYQEPLFEVQPGRYTPGMIDGGMTICLAGDVNDDNVGPDISDLSELVAYLYLQGPPLKSVAKANVDGYPSVDIGDVSALVSYLYLSGPELNCSL